MKKTIFISLLLGAAALTLSGCSAPSSHHQAKRRNEQKQEQKQKGKHSCRHDSDCRPAMPRVGVQYKCQQGKCAVIPLGNPASINCQKKGGHLEMKKGPRGEYGVCHFKDGSECEEWKFFRGQCHKGEHFSASSATNTAASFSQSQSKYLKGYLVKKKSQGWELATNEQEKISLGFPSSSGPLRDIFFFLNNNCVKRQCLATVVGEQEGSLLIIKDISLKNYPNLFSYFQEARAKIKEKYPAYPTGHLLQLEVAERSVCSSCYDFYYSFSQKGKKKTILVKIEGGKVRSLQNTINHRFYSCQKLLNNSNSILYRFPVCAQIVKITPTPEQEGKTNAQYLWKDFFTPYIACTYREGGAVVIGYYQGHCSTLHLK